MPVIGYALVVLFVGNRFAKRGFFRGAQDQTEKDQIERMMLSLIFFYFPFLIASGTPMRVKKGMPLAVNRYYFFGSCKKRNARPGYTKYCAINGVIVKY